MNLQRLYALFVARNMEFFRDHAALSWSLFLPVLLVVGFALAFSDKEPNLLKIGLLNSAPDSIQNVNPLEQLRHLKFITLNDRTAAILKVERHQIDLLLDQHTQHYWVNQNSASGYLAEQLLIGSSTLTKPWKKQSVTGKETRYIDWVIPGVIGMNMVFGALYGVGFVIVRYRKNGVLKRLQATPLSAVEFLVAQLISRLWILIAMGILIYAGLNLFLDFQMHGSYLTLLLVFILGAISLIALGLIIISRLTNEEVADGLINLISFPMMFLSGVWFSLEGAPQWMQHIANLFPLTHITAAARSVMLDGAGISEIWPELLILSFMSAVFLALGSWLFRWQN